MTSAGYCVDTMARATKMPMDSGATMNSTGMPRNFTLAGEDRYRSGRRSGSAMAAAATMTTARQPASTISPSTSWNTLEYTLQMVSPAMITLTRTMALIGECVRALTSASFSGISRSKDQANSDRIGSKFGDVALSTVAPIKDVSVIVTDSTADTTELELIERVGVEVIKVHTGAAATDGTGTADGAAR